MLVDCLRRSGVVMPEVLVVAEKGGEFGDIDWGEGADELVEASCDLENPESCESCQ